MSDTTPPPADNGSDLNEELVSAIRVAAAAVAGFGVTQLVRLGVHIDQTTLATGLMAVFSTVYYAGVRYLAKHAAWAERLLLLKKPNA